MSEYGGRGAGDGYEVLRFHLLFVLRLLEGSETDENACREKDEGDDEPDDTPDCRLPKQDMQLELRDEMGVRKRTNLARDSNHKCARRRTRLRNLLCVRWCRLRFSVEIGAHFSTWRDKEGK